MVDQGMGVPHKCVLHGCSGVVKHNAASYQFECDSCGAGYGTAYDVVTDANQADPHATPKGLADFKAATLNLSALEVLSCIEMLDNYELGRLREALETIIDDRDRDAAMAIRKSEARDKLDKLRRQLQSSASNVLGSASGVMGTPVTIAPNPPLPSGAAIGDTHHDLHSGVFYVFDGLTWVAQPTAKPSTGFNVRSVIDPNRKVVKSTAQLPMLSKFFR